MEVASGFTLLLPENDPYRIRELEAQRLFGANESIMVAFDVPELFRPQDLEAVQEFTSRAESVVGTSYVLGLANMPDLHLEGDELVQKLLYDPGTDPDLAEFSNRVLNTPLFHEFFVSADGNALLTYVVPDEGIRLTTYVERLTEALDEFDVQFFGDAVLETYVSHSVTRELIVLGSLALLVIMLVEMLISRSFIVGMVLSLVSAVPAVWTLALFPLFGQAVETTTMMVPVIVLVLATSYSVHLFRYYAMHGADIDDALQQVSKVVISAGVTTMVGFLSLVVTPSAVLRELGWLIIAGIVAGLVSSLVLFPPILARLPVRTRRRRPPDDPGERRPRTNALDLISGEPSRPTVRVLIAFVVILPFAVAIPSLRPGFSARDTFRPGSLVANTVDYFVERAQSNQQIQVIVDTGTEYGLVDMAIYNELKALDALLMDDPVIRRTTSFADFVEWMNGRLQGNLEPVPPQNEAELGEAMELLSGEGIEQLFDTLVDVEWRQARFLIQAALPGLRNPEASIAIEELGARVQGYREVLTSDPDVTVLGEPFSNLRYTEYLTRSQYISVFVFLPVLLLFLLFVFRSFGWAIITLIPTIVGVVIYFGTVSLLGFLHDPGHVFMVAALMGVSNDDVLYFVLIFKDKFRTLPYAEALRQTVHRTGVAIIQTTLIITAGIAVFFYSESMLLARAGLVAIIALWSASLTTLLVLPAVIKLGPSMRKKQSTIERELT